jgi:hypothetical protein
MEISILTDSNSFNLYYVALNIKPEPKHVKLCLEILPGLFGGTAASTKGAPARYIRKHPPGAPSILLVDMGRYLFSNEVEFH